MGGSRPGKHVIGRNFRDGKPDDPTGQGSEYSDYNCSVSEREDSAWEGRNATMVKDIAS